MGCHLLGLLLSYLLLFNSGPLEGIPPFSKGEILDDLASTKHETIRKTSANPIRRVPQADPNMEIYNDFVCIREKFLGLAGSLGPCPATFRNVLLHFRDTTIRARCWEAFGLNAYNL